jgi:hypothetical protein
MITEVIHTMQIASNANTQVVNDGINVMHKDMATSRAEVEAPTTRS